MTDISPIQMVIFAVEHIARIFLEWWRGSTNVVGPEKTFPSPLSTGLHALLWL